MADIIFSTQSSTLQNQNIHDGSVAVYWDMETCPVPRNISAEEAAANIRTALRAHQINGDMTTFSAYGDFTRFPQRITDECARANVTCICVPKGCSVVGAILADIFFSALDRSPPPYIMLISGDRSFPHALHRLGDRRYTVILAVPSGVWEPFRNAGSFVWDWPSLAKTSRSYSFPNSLNEVSLRHFSSNDSMRVQPGEKVIKADKIYSFSKRKLVTPLESSGGQLPLDKIESEGRIYNLRKRKR